MAEKYIKIRGELVAVTEEVYLAYYRQARKARFSCEKHQNQGVVSFQDLDTDEMKGEDTIPDLTSPSVEDAVIARIMSEKLHRCLALLPNGERSLLEKIYFVEMSERQVAQSLGIPYMTVHNRKVKALRKLRKMMAK